MKAIIGYIPHIHVLVLLYLGAIVIWKLNTFCNFMKEVLSEQLPDGKTGKGSSKRVVIMVFATYFLYAGIYSLHTDNSPDYYMVTLAVVFLLVALKILMPEQAESLLDKIKSFTTLSTKSTTPTEIKSQEQTKAEIK